MKEQSGGKPLNNSHYEYFYTTHFGLPKSFYSGKRILDIGCGPRGALEWADNAAERIGLDPLAKDYEELGIKNQKMKYVASGAENIPFPDGYFDVVISFNSLDHVDDLDKCIAEIIRAVKPDGLFLLLTDVNHKPTATEPISFSWDVVEKFKPALTLIEQKHYEKGNSGLYDSIKNDNILYNFNDLKTRYGILSAKFQKMPVELEFARESRF